MASPSITWLALPFAVGLLALNLSAWKNTIRLYRRAGLKAFLETFGVLRGSWRIVIVLLTCATLILFIALVPLYMRLLIPYPILILMGAVFIDNISRRIMPPAVLVLCASREKGVLITRDIKSRLMSEFFGGLRIAMLLNARISGALAHEYFYSLGLYNLRQISEKDWTIAVFRLMQIVPCIVIDIRYATGAMDKELGLIVEHQFVRKTLLLMAFGKNPVAFPSERIFRRPEDLFESMAQQLRQS